MYVQQHPLHLSDFLRFVPLRPWPGDVKYFQIPAGTMVIPITLLENEHITLHVNNTRTNVNVLYSAGRVHYMDKSFHVYNPYDRFQRRRYCFVHHDHNTTLGFLVDRNTTYMIDHAGEILPNWNEFDGESIFV
jgi:hypothetical protein